MSKKITHEQAREGLLQVYIYNDIHTNENNYVLVRDYITQQEKQEKLLELYKELATLYRDRFDYTNSATEIKKLWGKIKELENEI